MKVIKKTLLLGIITFIGLIGFSNSAVIREVGILGYSPRDNNMSLAVNVKGNLLSNKGGINRNMLFLNDNNTSNNGRAFFFWTNSGYPYLYKRVSSNSYEGVPYAFRICDELLSTDNPDSIVINGKNCGEWIYFDSESKDYIDSFLSTIQNNDLYFINSNYRTIAVAFSSSQLSKSIRFSLSTDSDSGGMYLCNSCIMTGSSLGFGSAIDFSIFNNSYLGQSPGVQSNYTQTNQYQCQTVQQLINTYPQEYNTGLCYSNNIIFSGTTIQTVTPKTIFEAFPTFTDFRNGINNYYNYCKAPATQETCQQAFETNVEGRQIINKIPNEIQALKLYEYCNLTLNLDPNGTTCTYTTGTIQGTGVTINNIITEIGNGNYTITTPGTPPKATTGNAGTGSVFDRITQQDDETQRRNIIQNAQNIIETMKNLYTKITGIFRLREGTTGIIPRYITSLILLFVLYKLFKK